MTIRVAFTIFLALLVFNGIGAAQEKVTVLQVGLLIDGSGGEPVKDAVILIQGKRVRAVGKSGEVKRAQGIAGR